MRITILLVLAIFISIVTACTQQKSGSNTMTNAATPAANAKWDAYVEQFLNDYFDANPQFAAYQGKHEYDGKFSDWSEAGLAKEISRLKGERDKASAFK